MSTSIQCFHSILGIILIIISVISLYTDIKYSKIYNKHLCKYLIIISITYILFILISPQYMIIFNASFINFVIGCSLCAVLYLGKLWAAGDAKLYLVLLLCLPLDLFNTHLFIYYPCIILCTLSFGIAFIYILIESIFLFFKHASRKHCCVMKSIKLSIQIRKFLLRYLSALAVSAIVFTIADFFDNNMKLYRHIILIVINACIMVIVSKLNNKILFYCLDITGILILIYRYIYITSNMNIVNLMFFALIPAVFLHLLKFIGSNYNYISIPVKELKTNMILSPTAQQLYMHSGRLSENDIFKIQESTKLDTISVKRQVPFAPFLCIAAFVLFAIRFFR